MTSSKAIDYILTKTLINYGIKCPKRLWLHFNERKKTDLTSQLYAGNRFGEKIRNLDASGLDLSKFIKDEELLVALNKTRKAINDECKKIYEGVFIFNDTLVRPDVLKKSKDGWELWEAKIKKINNYEDIEETHLMDIAIQYYVLSSCDINITCAKLIYPDGEFIYQGDGNYENLIKSFDVTKSIQDKCKKEVPQYIENFKKLASPSVDCPDIPMEKKKCEKPYKCPYHSVCKSEIKNNSDLVDYSFLPGQKRPALTNYIKNNNIKKIKDIPTNDKLLTPTQKPILEYHKAGKEHFDSELKNILKKYEWPFYFMDFEFVSQIVPIIKKTKAYDILPFQWSVHKWNSIDEEIKIEDGSNFLDFSSNDIELKFLESLLKALGNKGSIFVFKEGVEGRVLNNLKKKEICKHYSSEINSVTSRIKDASPLAKDYYYDTRMWGSYSLKQIIKSIPTSVSYDDEEGINDGMRANLAWFKCTDPNVSNEEKEKEKKLLLEYCAKDTYAMYDLVKYWMSK